MENQYGLIETIKNGISLIFTKLFYSNARLIRLPVYIRGKKKITFRKGLTTGYGCRFEAFNIKGSNIQKIFIGSNCKMGDHVHLAAGEKLIIGDNCLMASKIYISDISHGQYNGSSFNSSPNESPDQRPLFTQPVHIGDNVWIGENVSILPGTTIGNGCVIGANAVVNSNIPDNCIAVGIPARVIKKYSFSEERWIKFSNEEKQNSEVEK